MYINFSLLVVKKRLHMGTCEAIIRINLSIGYQINVFSSKEGFNKISYGRIVAIQLLK